VEGISTPFETNIVSPAHFFTQDKDGRCRVEDMVEPLSRPDNTGIIAKQKGILYNDRMF